jgi:hypothetical protein
MALGRDDHRHPVVNFGDEAVSAENPLDICRRKKKVISSY